jgi:imidazolonepropionase-like amidohydrolase
MLTKPTILCLILACLGPLTAYGQDAASGDLPWILFRGGTIHRVQGDPIESGVLGIQGHRIVYVGQELSPEIAAKGSVLDMSGKHLCPGFIDADTALGLIEIEAVRATNDTAETGILNPNAEAVTAFNPDSELLPVARADGILTAMSVPRGSFVTGRSALMRMEGWNATDMVLRRHAGLHITWPRFAPTRFPGRTTETEEKKREPDRRQQQLDELVDLFEDAKGMLRGSGAAGNLRLEAVAQVLQHEYPLYVQVDEQRGIEEAAAFAKRFDCQLMIVGGYDAPRCASLLKEQKIAVIVAGTHRLPDHASSPYDEPFTIPARLYQAGVSFCLAGHDRFSASGVRNLPQHAGTAVAFGLPHHVGLRSITLSAAEIVGAADQLGSLEVGKHATFMITTGDPLEIDTRVLAAYIDGKEVDLENRQKRLWRKYKTKYEATPAGS